LTTPRFLIFDLDGTLIDSSVGVVEAVNYSLEMTGHSTRPAEEISRYIGYPLKQMYAEFGAEPFDQLYRHFQNRASTSVIEASRALAGAESVVRHLHVSGYRMAIATTKVRWHVDQIVAKLGWRECFEALVGGDEVLAPKPDPAAFRLAVSRLGGQIEHAVVIGDTINDVLAARKISIPVVAVKSPYGGNDTLLASAPDYMIDTISELPLLLKEIQERKEAI
jgi:phosphoglycolate phosphatase